MATSRYLPIVNFVLGFSAIGISAGILLPHQGGLDAKIEAVRLAHEHSFAHRLKESDRRFQHVEQHVADLVLQQARLEAVIRARFPEARAELDAPLPELESKVVPDVVMEMIPDVVVEEVVVFAPDGVECGQAKGEVEGRAEPVALVAEGERSEVKVVGGGKV